MFSGIDFYSDTITKPSLAMKKAMMEASLGDEQRGEDPTTKRLEEEMMRRLGKTAALFFPSATMCNQIAVNLHCRPGDEVIGAEACHIFISEGAGAALHAGAQACPIKTKDGTFDDAELRHHVREKSPLTPRSSLVVVENTTNAGGGVFWPMPKLSSVIASAKQLSLKTHLDGARLYNAAIASDHDPKELASGFDTVTICFSKGLGCAIGAILAFDNEDFERVRRLKQVYGGAMRQSGILAAACLFALEHHVSQLAIDHKNAKMLAMGLKTIDAIAVENPQPLTNIVFFGVDKDRVHPDMFLEHCLKENLRFSRFGFNRFRALTHRDVGEADVEQAIAKLKKIFS